MGLVHGEPTLFEFKDRGDGFESITFIPHAYHIPCILYCLDSNLMILSKFRNRKFLKFIGINFESNQSQRCEKMVPTEESTLHGEFHDKITNKNIRSLYYFNLIETAAEHDAFVVLVKKVSEKLTFWSFFY